MITKTSDHIAVEGHVGTWYVIDDGWYVLTPDTKRGPETIYEHCFLLEHETYGDEAACLIVSEDSTLLLDDVYNGFEDLEDAGWAEVKGEAPGSYFYTFGSDTAFPFQNGWVEVRALSWEEAHEKFRARYPDRHENCLNCAFFYDVKQRDAMDPERKWHGYRCYAVIK